MKYLRSVMQNSYERRSGAKTQELTDSCMQTDLNLERVKRRIALLEKRLGEEGEEIDSTS